MKFDPLRLASLWLALAFVAVAGVRAASPEKLTFVVNDTNKPVAAKPTEALAK